MRHKFRNTEIKSISSTIPSEGDCVDQFKQLKSINFPFYSVFNMFPKFVERFLKINRKKKKNDKLILCILCMLLNYENWSSTTTPPPLSRFTPTPFFTLLVRQFKNSNISVSGFQVLPVLCSSRFGCPILMIYFWTLSYKVCEALGLAFGNNK